MRQPENSFKSFIAPPPGRDGNCRAVPLPTVGVCKVRPEGHTRYKATNCTFSIWFHSKIFFIVPWWRQRCNTMIVWVLNYIRQRRIHPGELFSPLLHQHWKVWTVIWGLLFLSAEALIVLRGTRIMVPLFIFIHLYINRIVLYVQCSCPGPIQ